MWVVVLGIFDEDFVHVGAGELEKFVGVIEHDEGDLTVTQHTQLVSLFHQTKLPLCKCHLREILSTLEVFEI